MQLLSDTLLSKSEISWPPLWLMTSRNHWLVECRCNQQAFLQMTDESS